MKDFYTRFYAVAEKSLAHHTFCQRLYGLDLCQHGFADLEQLDLLLQVTRLKEGQQVLDLGCGNGRIAEYLSDRSGAHVTGLDYIPLAIEQARERTSAKLDRLAFILGDINQLPLPNEAYDLITSIDTLYFSEDYTITLRKLKEALKQDGEIALFFSYGMEPWVPLEQFPKDKLHPNRTPLADALQANGLEYQTWDLSPQDYDLAVRRKEILAELKPQFEADGGLFIYQNRMGDAEGICQAIEAGCM